MSGAPDGSRVSAGDPDASMVAGNPIAHRKPLRILLADDCAASRILHLACLEQLGYPADAVANGEKALRALDARHYDIVLLDIDMPLMGGIRAAGKIREQKKLEPLFLVAVTAATSKLERASIASSGFDAYVAKPATADKFLAVLDEAYTRSRAMSVNRSPAGSGNNPSRADSGGESPTDESLAALVLRRVVPVYLRELPIRINALREALAARDAGELARLCHALKGAGRIFGASALAMACEKIESSAYAGQLPDAATLDELITLAAVTGTRLERGLKSEAPEPKL